MFKGATGEMQPGFTKKQAVAVGIGVVKVSVKWLACHFGVLM